VSKSFPLLTSEVATRVEACSIAFWVEKLTALRSLSGNPYEVEIRPFGDTTAFVTRKAKDNGLFNRVGNIRADDREQLEAIIAWFRSQHVPCRFDIIPSNAHPALLQRLSTKGFSQSAFHTAMYGIPHENVTVPPNIIIRHVLPEEKDTFVEIYLDSFGIPKSVPTLSYLGESIRLLIGRPSMHCLFAQIQDTLAAIAILYIREGVGYFATGATLPAWRGYGCQRALLEARIAIAAAAGCDLVSGQTGITTTSQHNMERVGLRIAYTKALWTQYK
jgi:GNAT superfamily N-acetyltransferase